MFEKLLEEAAFRKFHLLKLPGLCRKAGTKHDGLRKRKAFACSWSSEKRRGVRPYAVRRKAVHAKFNTRSQA
ncbi:hypothetical protein ScPMuIL_003791 [Solemya velum]